MLKSWRICLVWGLGCVALIGIGFALNATLPPQPRFVLSGAQVFANLSPDGRILTTGMLERDQEGESSWVSLKAWDTITGQARGEFFRGLLGSREVFQVRKPQNGFELGDGVTPDSLVYSPAGRYYALLHEGGLALADLPSGREWPTVVKPRLMENVGPETAAIYRFLRRTIATKPMHQKIPFKSALEYFTGQCDGQLKFRVDKVALAEELDADALDPLDEEVCLPEIAKMRMSVALRIVLPQIAQGNATFLIRRDFIEVTTKKRASQETIWPPVFSPGGSFVALLEGWPKENKLHVVECATGQLLASLSVHPDAWNSDFGFSADEELLYFYGSDQQKTLTVWSTKTSQITQTFPGIAIHQVAPDGKSVFANVGIDGVDLLDLQTGQTRRFAGKMLGGGYFVFSPDNRSLVRHTLGQLELWDVPAAKKRCTIALGEREGAFPKLIISADSRVLCALADEPKSFTAWQLKTGERLWPPQVPEPLPEPVPPPQGGPVEVLEHFSGGLMSPDEIYPRFTPDCRFLVERKEDRIDILEVATGEPHFSQRLGVGATVGLIGFTPDGQSMLMRWTYKDREPWLAEKWLAEWWPLKKTTGCFVVADVASGRVQLCVDLRADAWGLTPVLSDDGRTLLTSFADGDTQVISCWDVPGRPSQFLVLGIPLGLGCLGVLTRWWLTRRHKTTQPNPLVSSLACENGK